MNRRNFFKVVTGFVAGIFATSVEGKKFNTEDFGGWNPKDGWSAGIDPNSEWAKQKSLSVAELQRIEEALNPIYQYMPLHLYMENPKQVPYGTSIYPCFGLNDKLNGFYWRV